MILVRRLFVIVALTVLVSPPGKAQVFGTQDYNVTTIPAVTFTGGSFNISGSVGRYGNVNVDQHFYAPFDVPTGAVIDYIGLNNLNDGTPSAITVTLLYRQADGSVQILNTIPSQPHTNWQTDKNPSPFGETFLTGHDIAKILDVEIPPSPNLQFFGWVEVWWKRSVHVPTLVSFNDVPPSDPAYIFIEALASSGITAGCGGGNYCPDSSLTRRQMAVFLAKALGLHWPD